MRSIEIMLVFVAPDGTDGSAVAIELESLVAQAVDTGRRNALSGLRFIMARAGSDTTFVVPPAPWSVGDTARCQTFGSDREFRAKVIEIDAEGKPSMFQDAQGTILKPSDLVWYYCA